MAAQNKVIELTPLPSVARTTSGNSAAIENGAQFDEMLVELDVTAVAGTTPTLDAALQVSLDAGTSWINHTAFVQATGVTQELLQLTNIGWRWRINFVIGGTTPSFTFAVHTVLKRRGKG